MSLRIPFTIKISGQFVPGITEDAKKGILDKEYVKLLRQFKLYLDTAKLYKLLNLFPFLDEKTEIPLYEDTLPITTFEEDDRFTLIVQFHLDIKVNTNIGYEKYILLHIPQTFEMIEEMFKDIKPEFIRNPAFINYNFVSDKTSIEVKLLEEYKQNLERIAAAADGPGAAAGGGGGAQGGGRRKVRKSKTAKTTKTARKQSKRRKSATRKNKRTRRA